MKTSYNWLKEYVAIPWLPEELAEVMTMAGLEVEGIDKRGDCPDSVVIGEILSVAQHPNADRLSLCEVTENGKDALIVVCGAPNCKVGAKVAWAKVGTVLSEEMTITKARIRGIESHGMLCSEKELGLGSDHQGILILSEDAPCGQTVTGFVGTDTVIDWEVTPNRPDWLSHIGIAREIGAVSSGPVTLPEITLHESADMPHIRDTVEVEVRDTDLCPRYTARVIKNVKIGPGPTWMQECLKSVGLRPINNVVDITNFVLMECGQPLHAFDLHQVAGQKIIVRRAADGEIMTTLDNLEHQLNANYLVIADSQRSIALAGIMGGQNSEVSPETTDILLESAAFNAGNIRGTAKHLRISSESSYRFERGVDIDMVEYASRRAAQLICEYAGGTLVQGAIDTLQSPYQVHEVVCCYAHANRLLGVTIEPSLIKSILERLGLDVNDDNSEQCVISIPSYRLDLTREVDIIEEIARIYGYNNIPSRAAEITAIGGLADDSYYPLQQLRDQLIGLGLYECMNYSMVSVEQAAIYGQPDPETIVRLANPLSSDQDIMRPDLIDSTLTTIAFNITRGNHHLRLFEVGRTFRTGDTATEERNEAAVALSGSRHPTRFSEEKNTSYDFYDLLGLIEELMELRKIKNFRIEAREIPLFTSGICGDLIINDARVGILGQVSSDFIKSTRIKYPLFLALINLDTLLQQSIGSPCYNPLPQYPPVSRDVTFAADIDLEHQQVVDVINGVGVNFLEEIDLVDIYQDDKAIGKGKKSMAYTLTYRLHSRTLTDNEVNEAQETIRLTLIEKLPIQIR